MGKSSYAASGRGIDGAEIAGGNVIGKGGDIISDASDSGGKFFGAGTGSPFFSTDTAAALRAAEIDADVILLAKNIDGVYNADPAKDANAIKYDAISYEDVLAQHLAVMDSTATSLSMDNHIPVLVFALKDPENIIRAVEGEKIGTIVGEN